MLQIRQTKEGPIKQPQEMPIKTETEDQLLLSLE
jgi:hypothetical protein